MQLFITKTIIFTGLLVLVFLTSNPGETFAATLSIMSAPDVPGTVTAVQHVNGVSEKQPVPGVWVKWEDSKGNVRYARTDSNGKYNFRSWQDADRNTEANTRIDTDFDGTADAWQADAGPANGGDRAGYDGFGCRENPHKFTVIIPHGWRGNFGPFKEVNDINNSLATQPGPPFEYKLPLVGGRITKAGTGIDNVEVLILRGDGQFQNVYTNTNGSFASLPNFIGFREAYAVRPSRLGGFTSPSTTTTSWSWQHPNGPDTPAGSSSYESQELELNDCAGYDKDNNSLRCNFIYEANPVGYFDGGACSALKGWTCDADNYNTPLQVDFYTDGPDGQKLGIGSVAAASPRPDAAPQCGNNNNHGFSFAVPANSILWDGKTRNIYAYGINIPGSSGANALLTGSPKPVTCANPTLGDLKITADPSTQALTKGTYTVSGLRSDSSQGGSNYNNAIQITQNVNNGSTATLMGTAFTSKASPPENQTLSELVKSADTGNGFVIIYAQKTLTVAGQPFSAGNYYIHFKDAGSSWKNWETFTDVPKQDPTNKISIKVGVGSNPPSAPQFSVTLYDRIRNHTWGTYGYVYGDTGEQAIPEWPSSN